MKPYLFLLCFSVPVLAASAQDAPPPAAKTAPAEPATLSCWIHEAGYDDAGAHLYSVNFPANMVGKEKIGTPVAPCNAQGEGGFYRIDGDVPVEATWLSENEFLLRVFEGKKRTVATFIIPEGMVAELTGQRILGKEMGIGNRGAIGLERSSCYLRESDPVLFFTSDETEALEAALPGAYFRPFGKDGYMDDKRVPAHPRAATIGDVLDNWEQFKDIFSWGEVTASDKEFMETKDRATVLPGVWMVEFPDIPDCDTDMELWLPGLGAYDDYAKKYDDKEVATFRIGDFHAEIGSCRIDVGVYDVRLDCDQPVADDGADFFRHAEWQWAKKRGEDYEPMTWDEERQAFIATCEEGEVVLELDKETTQGYIQDIKLGDGRVIHGTKTVHMTATTPTPGVCIGSFKPVTSIFGKEYKENPDYRHDAFRANMSTELAPRCPSVRTDMLSSGLRGEGKRCIHCLIQDAESVTARVYRIDGQGADVAKLLIGYAQLYRHAKHFIPKVENFIETGYVNAVESRSNIGVPAILLPGRPEKAETELTPDGEGECTLDPASLFPGKDPHATYFVEIEAPVAQEAEDGTCVLNQGVVQVTDLGLMWKLSSGNIFAYVYNLTDGKKTPAATLHILDDNGAEMAQLPVQDGIATGELPKGARFLQVQSGTDCYTTRISGTEDRDNQGYSEAEYLMDHGVDPAQCMQMKSCVFTDRSLYRNGETAHLKGVLRFLQGNTLTVPELENVEVIVNFRDGEKKTFNATCEADGTFHLDIPIDDSWYGYGSVTLKAVYKGDADGTAPDMVAAEKAGLTTVMTDGDLEWYYEKNREIYTGLTVQDFRRNEFEVTSRLQVDSETRTVKISAEARDFNTAPVARGRVEWSVCAERINFYPKGFPDYYFGDYTDGPGSYFSAYYGSGSIYGLESMYRGDSGALDENGKGEAELTLDAFERPGRYRVVSTASVTNGNEQTLSSERSTIVDGSGVYAGLGISDNIAQAGQPIKMNAILVGADGQAWAGEPLPATITVKRTVFNPYRYGSKLRSAIRNEKTEEEYPAMPLTLGGTPTPVEIPTTSAGIYDITLEGKDADGKPFYTSVRKYVWGDDVSPWEYENGTDLELTADKDVYQVGDTAKILVQTPVDAELLVTVERDGVSRHYYRSVTVKEPVIEVPIDAADAPVCRVSVFLVQGAKDRAKTGLPVLKNAAIELSVDMPEKRLAIQLDTPQQAVTPTEECTVSGVVRDAAGNPVANAEIALYAEDEGTLQVMGYSTPALYNAFYSERLIGVATFNTLGQLLGDFDNPDYGNKGIFVGGGDDASDGSTALDPTVDRGPRRDFNPCALWLGHVTTDEQGRFTTTYTNPDTMTRYRVMAVASAGADKFGTSVSSYIVAQPIMLAPSAPLTATEGDCVDVPVTVTMLPKLMPAGAPEEIQWNVSLQSVNASVPSATQTVTLNSDAPATIHFPVTMKESGPVELTWAVAPATAQPGMEKLKDAVQLSFDVVPPTPHLVLPLIKAVKPGESVKPAALQQQQLRKGAKAELTVSLSPISGAALGVDYLFTYPYGCAEQLSSTLLPWLMADTLQKWADVEFPQTETPDKVEKKTVNKLFARQLGSGAFGYWEDSPDPSEFTPYVCLALSYSPYALSREDYKEKAIGYITKELKENKKADLLGLFALSRVNPMAAALLVESIQTNREQWTLRDRLLFACSMMECRERLKDEIEDGSPFDLQLKEAVETADKLLADKNRKDSSDYHAAPLGALRALFDIKCGKPDMVEDVRRYIYTSLGQTNRYSTWETAWVCIVIHEFCKTYEKQTGEPAAAVNGTKLEFGKPLRLKGALAALPELTAQGNAPVYLTGKAEGYTVEPQKVVVVDKGFRVQRHYEKLMPDGSWQATGTFEVGDVVRVTLSAKATGENHGRYLVAEDRLPAGFEAVNPMFPSQDLPECITREPQHYWWSSSYVDHKEYHKDRVQFFASSFWGATELEASYIVRVVKSGRMTAPAAKVELMYTPGIYGLSIPQEFTVKPRSK